LPACLCIEPKSKGQRRRRRSDQATTNLEAVHEPSRRFQSVRQAAAYGRCGYGIPGLILIMIGTLQTFGPGQGAQGVALSWDDIEWVVFSGRLALHFASCIRLFSYPMCRNLISDRIDTSYVGLLTSPSHELLEGAASEVPDMNDKLIGTLAWFRTYFSYDYMLTSRDSTHSNDHGLNSGKRSLFHHRYLIITQGAKLGSRVKGPEGTCSRI
jgi:hypothetical protein